MQLGMISWENEGSIYRTKEVLNHYTTKTKTDSILVLSMPVIHSLYPQ